VWQQPHLLYFAELMYRQAAKAEGCDDLVREWAELVDATACFMVSFVEESNGVYHLPPPLVPAQECYDRFTAKDPTFELAYWWWGLEIAQRWRERLGGARAAHWTTVQDRLTAPHQTDGRYDAIATDPYLRREDHPSLLGGFGMVPQTPVVDPNVMRATLLDVLADWQWESAWGWDFRLVAMTATRVGEPARAIAALLSDEPKNTYLVNGHNPQRGNRLPVYLPGNGGLLAAVSLMVGGWDGSELTAPGFPDDGTWQVRHEGFTPWP
jgi:hypothetical protein